MAADVRPDGGHALTEPRTCTVDTIYALSSGSPPAAVAVVRVSGPGAAGALKALAGELPPPRYARVATLRDPETSEVLDNALVIRFSAPRSATGEDVVELHLHGGRSVVAAVLGMLRSLPGMREAEPGEFTRRAFENGRIDLAEAEGLADLIEAETETQRRAALGLAGGALSRQVEVWQQRLLAVAAAVEAALDFSDEGDVAETAGWTEPLASLRADLEGQLERPSAERLRDGIRIAIAGPPNAGKSTLLNALAGREAAITSPIAGTTRDLVEAPTAIGGIPFLFTDTAGLRESTDAIEVIGVDRARSALAAADLILWLGPPSECPDRARSLILHSKADIEPPVDHADLDVSPVSGEGMDALLRLLLARARVLLPREGEVALNARHRAALAEAAQAMAEAAAVDDPILVAEALRAARVSLDRITGRAGVEDMLDSLFGRFCIGK